MLVGRRMLCDHFFEKVMRPVMHNFSRMHYRMHTVMHKRLDVVRKDEIITLDDLTSCKGILRYVLSLEVRNIFGAIYILYWRRIYYN